MKNNQLIKIAVAFVLASILTACSANNDGNRVIIKEPGKTITIIDDGEKEQGKPAVSVDRIERYEGMAISDWLNETAVIVSKENDSLGKMRLDELSHLFPTSLYLYDLETKTFKVLKEQENMLLGGAALSPDKEHLLFYGNTLGDPLYYVMDFDTSVEAKIPQAYSAKWADNETVIGGSYNGGAYMADPTGKITPIDALKDEAVFIVTKVKDKVYYNTNSDSTLRVLDLATNQKKSLGISNAYNVVSSPDGDQLLVLQDSGSKQTMILCDADGGNIKTIAEGTELNGVSWSPDQQRIAYGRKAVVNGTTASGLYVHDRMTGEATQIVVDVQSPATSWNPSGTALAYSEWDGVGFDSSIIYLNYALKK